MVKHASRDLDAVFAALADPTRRAILARLRRGSSSVSLLAAPFPVSLPAISKHLGVLERAGLISRSRSGRVSECRLDAGAMRGAAAWLADYEAFWTRQLDALDAYLTGRKDNHANRPRSQRLAVRTQGARRARRKGPRV
jgi:DNA-binding transcriptional ArsR family regulator